MKMEGKRKTKTESRMTLCGKRAFGSCFGVSGMVRSPDARSCLQLLKTVGSKCLGGFWSHYDDAHEELLHRKVVVVHTRAQGVVLLALLEILVCRVWLRLRLLLRASVRCCSSQYRGSPHIFTLTLPVSFPLEKWAQLLKR